MAAVMDILRTVKRKNAFDANTGFFTLDRAYVQQQTTISEEEQWVCDKALQKANILFEDDTDKNKITVDMEKLIALITTEDTTILDTVATQVKKAVKAKSVARKEGQILSMCMHCDDLEPDEELRELYHAWVKSVMAKNYLTFEVINVFVAGINEFSSDKAVKAGLLNYAISTGYKSPVWVINGFKRNGTSGNLANKQSIAVGLAEEVF